MTSENRDPNQVPAARELTPALREHLRELLATHGVADDPAPASPARPHVVGAAPPAAALAGAGGLSGLLTSSVVNYVLGMVVRLIQAEVVPPLMAALEQVRAQHPDFNPELILAPINKLLAYFGGPPVHLA